MGNKEKYDKALELALEAEEIAREKYKEQLQYEKLSDEQVKNDTM